MAENYIVLIGGPLILIVGAVILFVYFRGEPRRSSNSRASSRRLSTAIFALLGLVIIVVGIGVLATRH